METWRKGFHKALVDAVVANGSLVRKNASFYGWRDYSGTAEMRKKVAKVGVDYNATKMPKETSWHEFQGTFYEGDTRVVGIELDVVLKDGTVGQYRWEANMSDLIQAVLLSKDEQL